MFHFLFKFIKKIDEDGLKKYYAILILSLNNAINGSKKFITVKAQLLNIKKL